MKTYRQRQARKAQARTFLAHLACALVCIGVALCFAFLGIVIYPAEPVFSFIGMTTFIGLFVGVLTGLWFLIAAPRYARDAYLEVLFSRSAT